MPSASDTAAVLDALSCLADEASDALDAAALRAAIAVLAQLDPNAATEAQVA